MGDISTTLSGGTPKTSNRKFYDGNIPFIKSGEIGCFTTEQKITEDAILNSSAKKIYKGDLLLTLKGVGNGKVAISKLDGAINEAVLKIDNNMDNIFQYNYFLKDKDKIVAKYVQGGHSNLNAKIIKNLIFFYPSIQEQKKIANFLKHLDKKIEFMEKKHKLLEEVKKFCMQNLFPNKYNDTPQLRFPEFIGEWKEKKYFELSEFIKSGKSNKDDDGKYSFYGSTGIIGKTNETYYSGIYIIIARVGAAGNVYLINEDKCGISDNTLVIKHNSKINYYFSLYYLKQYNFKRLIIGSGRPLITGNDVKKIRIKIPSIEEQEKIASFLKTIDKKIEHIEKKHTLLKKFKKGLLQKMFC